MGTKKYTAFFDLDHTILTINSGEALLKEAYKKKVMNRKKIEETKMNEMLKISLTGSPREIMRRLKEIDKG